MMKIILRVQW